MTVEDLIIKKIKDDPSLIKELLFRFCPAKFGIPNSFVEMALYDCTRGCYHCWSRTEDEVEKDKEIWDDYNKTDFSKTDYDQWLKKWGLI